MPLNSLTEAFRRAEVVSSPGFRELSEHGFHVLHASYAQHDLERLAQSGMAMEVITFAVMMISLAPGLDDLFRGLGGKQARLRDRKVLLSSVPVLRRVGKRLKAGGRNLHTRSSGTAFDVASGVQFYADLLVLADAVHEVLETNSFIEMSKYALSGAVKRITGQYHDREVSALISRRCDARH